MTQPLNSSTAHHTTVELANSKLTLRPELSFHLREYQDSPCYLIEDELNSTFFRVGIAEYNLISLFDGSTTVAQALAQNAAQMGDQALTESDAITICKWLLDSNLATTSASRTADRLIETYDETNRKKTIQKLNPITPKIPLFNPDHGLSILNRGVGWIFSFPMGLVWAVVVATGIYQVFGNWEQASSSASQVFASENWIWLGLTWLGLKFFHELSHGIVCKRFGGTVRQAGIVLILLIPLPYVDVTSSWRFSSKWQKIYVAAAGMYCEIFLAAIAAIVWANVEPGILKTQCYNIMLAGSITTLLFNANPLMRFDGYYILTDWLEQPNLGTHGQQFLSWVGKRYYLGLDSKKPSWPEGRGSIVAGYAVAAFCWRILICVALIFTAESLLFGAGFALAALAFAMWVLWPIAKLLRFVFVGNETEQKPSAIRFCGLTAMLTATAWAVCVYVPWHSRIQAPAVVDFAEKADIRTPVSGFVTEILVKPDQHVEAGETLATLSNQELLSDIQNLKLQIRTAELRARIYKQPPRQISAYDVEVKTRASLIKRLKERLEQKEQLTIRAPMAGQIIADDLDVLLGTYLAPGHKICGIGSTDSKRIEALISQHDFEFFQTKQGQPVDVHIWGRGVGNFEATLEKVDPRAKSGLSNPAFSSTTGGPLAVKYKAPSASANDSVNSTDDEFPFELVNPRFRGQIRIPVSTSASLRPGQLGFVSFRTSKGSVGEVLSERTTQWLRKMRAQNQTPQ